MAAFLDRRGVRRRTLKCFLLRQAYLIKDDGHRMVGEFMTRVDDFDNPRWARPSSRL